jgi:hypothetical protein
LQGSEDGAEVSIDPVAMEEAIRRKMDTEMIVSHAERTSILDGTRLASYFNIDGVDASYVSFSIPTRKEDLKKAIYICSLCNSQGTHMFHTHTHTPSHTRSYSDTFIVITLVYIVQQCTATPLPHSNTINKTYTTLHQLSKVLRHAGNLDRLPITPDKVSSSTLTYLKQHAANAEHLRNLQLFRKGMRVGMRVCAIAAGTEPCDPMDPSQDDILTGRWEGSPMDIRYIYNKLVHDIKSVDSLATTAFKYSRSAQDNSKSFESHDATPGILSRQTGMDAPRGYGLCTMQGSRVSQPPPHTTSNESQ